MKDQSETKQARPESEGRKAERALKESEESGWTILENIQEGYYEVNLAGNFTFLNSFMSKILGYTKEELVGMNYRLYTDKENAKKIFCDFNEVYRTGITSNVEYEQIKKDGSKMRAETSVALMRDSLGQPTGFRGIVRDITERKRAEEALRKNEEFFRAIIENATDIILVINKKGRIIYTSPSVEHILGYKPEDLIGKRSLDLIASADVPRAIDDFRKAISTNAVLVPNAFRIRHKDGTERFLEGVGKNLSENSSVAGFVMNVRDVSERKRVDERLKETLGSLRKAVSATIQVLASAVEVRDPYTAGHQIRSANLARTIAAEMGLPHEKIEGIRVAGSVHDIGKLSIPADILSKPRKLSEMEFELMKDHARQGYEILKNVQSPWPLAEIVYQHHERLDGSGYPRKLKGGEILIEARILTVADVVEAMASHRPYRPGLGIDAALNEIEKNSGIFYDNTVVDVCLRLFREKGFQLAKT